MNKKIFRKKFLVIIPTHNHPESLNWAIESVLSQTNQNFNLVVIGDGVGPKTRKIMDRFRNYKNIFFVDSPKTNRHGEEIRDLIIREFKAKYVTYLCDDDLFLREHLEVMEKEIVGFDFVHPQTVFVNKDKQISSFFRTNLKFPSSMHWQLNYANSISLTGVTHTYASYISLPVGWTTTPFSRATDHYMWDKFFSKKSLRFKSSKFSTTIKMPQAIFNETERENSIKFWYKKTANKNFFKDWNEQVQNTIERENVEKFVKYDELSLELSKNMELINIQNGEIRALSHSLNNVYSSHSWKVTKPLRDIASFFRKKF